MINESLILNLINQVNCKFYDSKKIIENKEKCARDIKFFLEALSKDLKFKTTIFTTRIGNRFWYNEKCQLKTNDTEIKVYNFILSKLENLLEDQEIILAKQSIEKLIEIIKNGPIIDDFGSQIVQDVVKAEHCQRNWDLSKKISEDDLDALIKVATTMPTKQNRNYYKLIVSTDVNFNKKIHNLAADPNNNDTPLRNSQVAANALFIYISNSLFDNDNKKFKDNHSNNTAISVGISSGALALAAAQMEYRIGFCQCFLNKNIKKALKIKGITDLDDENIMLLVGVGHPKKDHQWYTVIDEDNKIIKHIEPETKIIEVKRI